MPPPSALKYLEHVFSSVISLLSRLDFDKVMQNLVSNSEIHGSFLYNWQPMHHCKTQCIILTLQCKKLQLPSGQTYSFTVIKISTNLYDTDSWATFAIFSLHRLSWFFCLFLSLMLNLLIRVCAVFYYFRCWKLNIREKKRKKSEKNAKRKRCIFSFYHHTK